MPKQKIKTQDEGPRSLALGRAIRFCREALGLSQDELAVIAGIEYASHPGTAVQKWEVGGRVPTFFEFHRVCVALLVTESELVLLAVDCLVSTVDPWTHPIPLRARERLPRVRGGRRGEEQERRVLAVELRQHDLLVHYVQQENQTGLFDGLPETRSHDIDDATIDKLRAKLPPPPAGCTPEQQTEHYDRELNSALAARSQPKRTRKASTTPPRAAQKSQTKAKKKGKKK
jgi:transcriptional regulator with XRE-family HTH domain